MLLFSRHKREGIRGAILVQVLAFSAIGIIILAGMVNWTNTTLRMAVKAENKSRALQVAEAGIEYYRWHLAHDPTDFQDGTATSGPYAHNFYDAGGNAIGRFILTITPPPVGSTRVYIQSAGAMFSDVTATRTLRVQLGKPSFAKFAVLSNTDYMSIGADIYGQMHSNGIIDLNAGTAYNIVTSSRYTGTSTTSGNCNGTNTCWGVTSFASPADNRPPTGLNTTTSRFTAGRSVGVPAIDFAGITSDLAQLKTDAQADGRYYAASGGLGYHIVLQTNDTFDIYRVDTQATGGGACNAYVWWTYPSCPTSANSKWSINTQTLIGNDVPFPNNGIIFAEDHVWVNGTINTARVTIVAAQLPDPGVGLRKNIIVNNDLLYTNKDGQDVIGLIAQDNFWVGLISDNDLEIDAAIIAQNGRVSRYAYGASCGGYQTRNNITFYGMFATNQRYAYGNLGSGCSPGIGLSGYQTSRTYIYDPYLLYGPPPSFPLTTDDYQILSWEEL
jgi:hypothetical protein